MPLHLLGKKSWNVYNPENIAHVRRDEVEARAKEEAEERDCRAAHADVRLQQLRDETDRSAQPIADESGSPSHAANPRHDRKRRKLAGEDDTDRDIRLAKDDTALTPTKPKATNVSPITDSRGHINLIPQTNSATKENAEVIAEKKRRERDHEDQYTMRLANAGGRDGTRAPWYSEHKSLEPRVDFVGKDVWGNEDPRRRLREQARLSNTDPLAAMKKGVQQLREAERHRKEWMEQRERDLNEVEQLARAEPLRKKRSKSAESLDNFDLDTGYHSSRNRHRHRSRHADDSLKGGRHRHRHRRPGDSDRVDKDGEHRGHSSHRLRAVG